MVKEFSSKFSYYGKIRALHGFGDQTVGRKRVQFELVRHYKEYDDRKKKGRKKAELRSFFFKGDQTVIAKAAHVSSDPSGSTVSSVSGASSVCCSC